MVFYTKKNANFLGEDMAVDSPRSDQVKKDDAQQTRDDAGEKGNEIESSGGMCGCFSFVWLDATDLFFGLGNDMEVDTPPKQKKRKRILPVSSSEDEDSAGDADGQGQEKDQDGDEQPSFPETHPRSPSLPPNFDTESMTTVSTPMNILSPPTDPFFEPPPINPFFEPPPINPFFGGSEETSRYGNVHLPPPLPPPTEDSMQGKHKTDESYWWRLHEAKKVSIEHWQERHELIQIPDERNPFRETYLLDNVCYRIVEVEYDEAMTKAVYVSLGLNKWGQQKKKVSFFLVCSVKLHLFYCVQIDRREIAGFSDP